jgi:hypothetical protein
MTWPQVVMLVWMLFGTATAIKREMSNRDQSAGWATFGVLVILAIQGGLVAVLHAGGFW